MPLVSMKTDESRAYSSEPSPYGYGLSIRLNEDQCKALGIVSPPPAGTVYTVEARAVAREVTQEVENVDKPQTEVCMCLQITDLSLGPAPTQGPSAASVLYGD